MTTKADEGLVDICIQYRISAALADDPERLELVLDFLRKRDSKLKKETKVTTTEEVVEPDLQGSI